MYLTDGLERELGESRVNVTVAYKLVTSCDHAFENLFIRSVTRDRSAGFLSLSITSTLPLIANLSIFQKVINIG